jgi:hypothetical protein
LAGGIFAAALILSSSAAGQTIDGNLVGSVWDPSKAAVAGASVEILNIATGVKAAAKTGADGSYRFSDVQVGNYTITATAANFATTSLKDVTVELNKTTTAILNLQLATVATAITVTDAPVLLDTTTAQITSVYPEVLAKGLAIAADPAGGVLNLALLGAGVASSGGLGSGTGPSVGGQRPRNNTFTVEGVDNNRRDVTGPVALVPNDGVAEFTVLQNQFSAEFGRSAGGQFNVALKSGSNTIHGSLYEYLQNRNLDAIDHQFIVQGIRSQPRYDQNRFGGDIGGPIVRNRLFYYGLLEYNPIGYAATSPGTYTPTADGYATLASMQGLSQTNLGVLQKYLPPAPVASPYVATVKGVDIPIGPLPIAAPSYSNTFAWLGSVDYSISAQDQLRVRYTANHLSALDVNAGLPQFYANRQVTSELVSLSEFHSFRPDLLNEVRVSYNRFNNNTPLPNTGFPGLNAFPNIYIQDVGVQVGPDPNAPQVTIQNNEQLTDSVSWMKGKHDVKFGVDLRNFIASTNFVTAQRGDYEYSRLQNYLLDLSPDLRVQRSIGNDLPYSGNASAFYAFANDDWRVSRHLTLNLGVRYEYNGVAQGMREQALNSVANVPGVLTFAAPTAQKLNFAPRVGFAYTPGTRATTVLRGGFGMGYDPIFDNAALNTRPPQASSLLTLPLTGPAGFLANGGITPNSLPSNIRAATSGYIPDQKLGYVMNWNLGVQHEFAKDYTLEVRYLGTRGVHLLMQTQLNRNSLVSPSAYLPTYLQAPSQAVLNALPVTLAQLQSVSNNPLAPYGFTNTITAYGPQGSSMYNGLAVELKKRLSRSLLLDTSYTWSHALDNSTADTNTTALSPRRPQDSGNLTPEWGTSALDRRHRLTATWLYQTPWFEKSSNFLERNLLGGYQLSGTYFLESPEYVTPQGATDANLNGDPLDRTIVNPAGVPNTGSGVKALTNSAGATVAYVPKNPNAEYIAAGKGALSNAGRNTMPTPRINNWDMTLAKNVSFRERARLQLRADFFNVFNHHQYTPGRIDSVIFSDTSALLPLVSTSNPLFGKWSQVFSSNPRVIQLGAKITF